MKKCVQCTKDLPDAALHCVFCGSKQPAQAPAEVARTVMGYSANQVREQLAAQAAAQAASQPGARHPPSAPPPMGSPMGSSPGNPLYASPAPHNPRPMPPPPPQPSFQPPQPSYQPPPPPSFQPPPPSFQPPSPQPSYQPPQPSYQPPQPSYPSPPAPAFPPPVASSAATLFVPNNNSGPSNHNPGPGSGHNPMAATMAAPSPMMSAGPGGYGGSAGGYSGPSGQPASSYVPPPSSSPYQPPSFVAPPSYQPVPVPQSPPYLASQTADRPVDPFRDGLRLVLFAFGILLLGAFCTPLSSAPTFHWNTVLADLPLAGKVPSLLLAVVGALAIIIASTPLASAVRGLLAALIALLGIVTPIALARSFGEWRAIVTLVAPLLLVPGLLLRQEYREEILPRLLVTIAVIAMLALWLVPEGGALPLVRAVKGVVDASGTAKVAPLLELVYLVMVVLTLLVWVPAPNSGGAKLFAWILIFWHAALHFQRLILAESPGELIKQAPYENAMAWAPVVAYLAILGYGLAALIGKRFENA